MLLYISNHSFVEPIGKTNLRSKFVLMNNTGRVLNMDDASYSLYSLRNVVKVYYRPSP